MTVQDTKSPVASLKTQIEQVTQAMSLISNTINQFHGNMTEDGQVLHPEIQKLYDEMQVREADHQVELSNIDSLVGGFIQQSVYEGLEGIIKPEMIDAIVKQRVAEELKSHMSQKLLQELEKIHKEIEQVKLELHNSESRRQNASLKFGGSTQVVLNPIKKTDGNVSNHFPKTLGDLSRLDGGIVSLLMIDYQMSSPEDPMPLSLNRFIQFCGVRYQKVENPDSSGPG